MLQIIMCCSVIAFLSFFRVALFYFVLFSCLEHNSVVLAGPLGEWLSEKKLSKRSCISNSIIVLLSPLK